MSQAVKNYKVLLDNKTTNADKNIVVNFDEIFQFQDQTDLIHLRSEQYIDDYFNKENPTIDFEKYKFKPDESLLGFDFYFYTQTLTSVPVSYNIYDPPVWTTSNLLYKMSSGFEPSDLPKSTLFLDSYFKFEFFLDPVSQKTLFSVTLPLDGTMLQPVESPKPKVDFHQIIKTELEYIYWLRNPQQLTTFTGNTFDIYCLVSFFNSKTGKVINFKRNNFLPNSLYFLSNYTIQDKYFIYRLDYSTLTYQILQINGHPFTNNRIKLYAI